jgi:hypothetical protein
MEMEQSLQQMMEQGKTEEMKADQEKMKAEINAEANAR